MIRRQRVIHVSLGLDVGGQEKLLVEFARHANRELADLHFLSLTGRGRLAETLENLGWLVTALDEPPGLRPRLILRLAQAFRELHADVVHTHDDKPLIYGAPAARLARVRRHVHTHHHGRLPQTTARQEKLLALAARLPQRMICVSDDCQRWLRGLGVADEKLVTLRNGIDLKRFPYHGPQAKGPAVCIARLSPEKDIANLLHASALAAVAAPDFRLEIAGDGPLRKDLLQLRQELGLADRVAFLGEVSKVPELLARARLFVLPSLSEGVSLTLLEAMATGLPVAATRVGGNPEVVAEGGTGFLVSARDPGALAARMLELWGDSGRSQQLGEAGRRRVENHFDIRVMVARYEALYRSPRSSISEIATGTPCMS